MSEDKPKEKSAIIGKRKFIITCFAVIFLFTSLGLSFYLRMIGEEPLLSGGHFVGALGLIVGLYGGSNVLAKLKNGGKV